MEHAVQEIPGPVDAYEAIFVPAMLGPLARLTLGEVRLEKGARLMDLACGTGIVARQAAPILGRDGVIVAVDVSPQMLAKARSLPAPAGAPIEWREGDAAALDLPDGTFDIVICQQGLQYFPDPARGVAECRRTVKDGGRAVFSTWRGLEQAPLFRELVEVEARHLEKLGLTYEDIAAPFLMDSTEDLRDLFEVAGFSRVVVTEVPMEVRFPSAARLVEDVEVAYASLVPQFAANPGDFSRFRRKGRARYALGSGAPSRRRRRALSHAYAHHNRLLLNQSVQRAGDDVIAPRPRRNRPRTRQAEPVSSFAD